MRLLAIATLSLLLAGCASPLPEPRHDLAWIDLRAPPADLFMADRVDKVQTPDGRYFEVSPGRHVLEARYEFEVSGGGGFGELEDRTVMRCSLVIDYAQFRAGERYLFEARALGFQPQGWLLDSQRREVAQAQARHCW